jgi:hypothetical protein
LCQLLEDFESLDGFWIPRKERKGKERVSTRVMTCDGCRIESRKYMDRNLSVSKKRW